MKHDDPNLVIATADREKVIVKTSIVGILANVLLAAFKAVVGAASHSIAVILDAVNNLTDALSSLVTIVGAKLGAKAPNKKHPLGYGRIEYLSAMIVAALVLYAGITSFVESVKKILHPSASSYSTVSLIIIAVAIGTKLILGHYVKKKGEAVNSGALVASGADASFDAILSASVLLSALLNRFFGLSLEAYVGILLSAFIIKAGFDMMSDTLDDLIGHRSDPGMVARVKKVLNEAEEVNGAYDLFLFNYGPEKYYGTAHVELPDTMTVDEVDLLIRHLQYDVYEKTGVIMTGIGVYSYNTIDKKATQMENEIRRAVMGHDWALQMHGFYVDHERMTIHLDVVVSFDVDPAEALKTLYEEVEALYPDYKLQIVPDVDVSGEIEEQ